MPHKVVCVLGAYRSGTSMLMNLLNKMGVFLGKDEDLIPGLDGMNSDGFFQHRIVEDINQAILGQSDTNGIIFTGMKDGWEKRIHKEQQDIDLFIRQFSESSLWGFKSNLMNFLVSVWNRPFLSAGLEPYYVLIVRNPQEAVKSMQKAWDISKAQAAWLWFIHNFYALKEIQGNNYKIVLYDEILNAPQKIIHELNVFLHIHANPMYVASFVKKDFRHNVSYENGKREDRLTQIYQAIIEFVHGTKEMIDVLRNMEKEYSSLLNDAGTLREARQIILTFSDTRGSILKTCTPIWQEEYRYSLRQYMDCSQLVGEMKLLLSLSGSDKTYVKTYGIEEVMVNGMPCKITVTKFPSIIDTSAVLLLEMPKESEVSVELHGVVRMQEYPSCLYAIKRIVRKIFPMSVKHWLRHIVTMMNRFGGANVSTY